SLHVLKSHSNPVFEVLVTADGRYAVSTSAQGICKGQPAQRSKIAHAPASPDRALRLWDLESGQLLRTLTGHTDGVNALAITPAGRRAISASTDRTLRVWDLETGQSVRTLAGHAGPVNAVAITPDGHCAISASSDWTLRVWDLESGQSVRTLTGHTGWV